MLRLRKLPLIAAMLLTSPALVLAAEPADGGLPEVKKNVNDRKAVLVDVREKAEWDAGHVAGAVFLPLSELQGLDAEALAQRLPQNRFLYTHCVVGKRSARAARILQGFGYKARSLDAGYDELVEAGFPAAPMND